MNLYASRCKCCWGCYVRKTEGLQYSDPNSDNPSYDHNGPLAVQMISLFVHIDGDSLMDSLVDQRRGEMCHSYGGKTRPSEEYKEGHA